MIIDTNTYLEWSDGIPAVNLSGMFPDIGADVSGSSVLFTLKNAAGQDILSETYKSHDNRIMIKGLREILSMYLRRKNTNLIIGGQNNQIWENFQFILDSTKTGDVIYSRMKSNLPAEKLKGDLFLTTQYLKKITMPGGREFLTFFFRDASVEIGAKMYYLHRESGQIMSTAYVPIEGGRTNFYAFETSFNRVRPYFPSIDPADCLFYRVGNDGYNVEYLIDRSTYPNLTQFVFMNNFGVPETLYIRGEVIHNIDASFDEGKVQRISRKWNQRENETFEASTGKIFLRDEYLMWRDLFMSPDVYIYVNGSPRKVFVTEAKNSMNRLKGINKSLTFTFRFAEENDTWDYMRYLEWILENGVWNDEGIWLDNGQWNETP